MVYEISPVRGNVTCEVIDIVALYNSLLRGDRKSHVLGDAVHFLLPLRIIGAILLDAHLLKEHRNIILYLSFHVYRRACLNTTTTRVCRN